VRYRRTRLCARVETVSRPLPRHPARHATRCGWQVSWLAGHCALPPSRSAWLFLAQRRANQWLYGQALTAHSCGGSRGLYGGRTTEYHIPSSLSRFERGHRRRQYTVAQACCQWLARLGTRWPLLRRGRWLTLRLLSGARLRNAHRVKREAGASDASLHSGTAPATVSERPDESIRPLRMQRGKAIRPHELERACARESGDRPDGGSGYLRGGRTRRS
jgi:hypothetical protein